MNGKPRVALLIDADNSPASKIGLILNELSTFGETNVRRAYGNWKKNELCLLYTSPSPRDRTRSRMPSSA